MSYLLNKFNIKTMPAETLVFCNGILNSKLSTLKNSVIDKQYDKPVHIIYIGKLTKNNNFNIDINVPNQIVYLSVNITNKTPVFFNIFIKNTGKNSKLFGHIMLNNDDNLTFNCLCEHTESDTAILIQTKLLAGKNTFSKISGTAKINKNCKNTDSDISLAVLADKNAKIEFMPAQKIESIPNSADHSAYIYHSSDVQIQYLLENGLSYYDADNILRNAFKNNFSLF